MLQIEDLMIAYQGKALFEQATFCIQEGERCGLVGRNGSGKSTLFRLMTGEETQDSGTISRPKNYRVGALSQHIRFTQPTILAEAALALSHEERESLYKAEKILFGLGFNDEDMERSPQDLSGGYQLRLHLAKVLISEPNCLLLDEPTNYLDIVSIRWFARFLQQWKGEFILVSHDREFMDSVTTHTMGIHRGKVRKVKGGTIDYFDQILQQEEVHERTRANLDKKRAHAQSFIDRFGAKATKAAQAQSRQKLLDRIPTLERLKEIHQLGFQFNEAPFHAKKMLEAKEVSFAYDSPLIDHFSLTLEKGERVAIIGKNGRGKSTILRLLAKELTPCQGTLAQSENMRLGYFGQTNINRLHPQHTVEEEIATANPSLNRTEVKGIAGLMMFSGGASEKRTSILSGGEKSRVLLGKILATPCNLLLLDEPTHHLDLESVEALIDALEDFDGAVVLVTHSELILKRLPLDKIVVCRQGRQELFLGGYQEFLESGGWHDEGESSKPKKKSGDQREIKQQKAEQVAARSKLLKPLETEIAKMEKAITELEIEQQKAQAKLLELAQSANGQAIQELSIAVAARQKKIDGLFDALLELSSKRENILS
ncbi:MAG: ABC-F family ATP-binding cassette domain-containing protein [Parachlamydia sp.]|nr:ABC-F family ATP-binding cassette domain-containing protein [Parachlamydia sp.]